MRLLQVLNADSEYEILVFEEFIGQHIPTYAILSHCWGDDEVLFKHAESGTHQQRAAFVKVRGALRQARLDGLDWLWIDTCCIDKSSSAELQEAINSMFRWYSDSAICYVYMADVTSDRSRWSPTSTEWVDELLASRWFTRGWTLQELLAPQKIAFFNRHWRKLGMLYASSVQEYGKSDAILLDLLSKGSKIAPEILTNDVPIEYSNVATRMSWAAGRASTRLEDVAYCLVGIFGVNMPLLYGEGANAFFRLQKEIMEMTDDESILSWVDEREDSQRVYGQLETGPLAPSPSYFRPNNTPLPRDSLAISSRLPHRMTNRGLHIELPLQSIGDNIYLARLNCNSATDGTSRCIYLKRLFEGRNDFVRIFSDKTHNGPREYTGQLTTIFIKRGLWPWPGGYQALALQVAGSISTMSQYQLRQASVSYKYNTYFDDDEVVPSKWIEKSWDGLVDQKLFMGAGQCERGLKLRFEHVESGDKLWITIERTPNWPLIFFAELQSLTVSDTGSACDAYTNEIAEVGYEVVGTTVLVPEASPRHKVKLGIFDVTTQSRELQLKHGRTDGPHSRSVIEKCYKLELDIEWIGWKP